MLHLKRILFFVFLSISVAAAPASYDLSNLDQLTEAELARMLPEGAAFFGRPIGDREYWSKPGIRQQREAIRKIAQERLAKPVDFTGIDWKDQAQLWTNTLSRASTNLSQALLAECIDNQGEYLPVIRDLLTLLLDQPTWMTHLFDTKAETRSGETQYFGLISGLVAQRVALADWVLGDKLPPELRARIRGRGSARRSTAGFSNPTAWRCGRKRCPPGCGG